MSDVLEIKVKALEDEISDLKQQLQVLQDIEDIKRLQCAYGYYLERWMGEEIIDCFSTSPEVSGTFVEGTYKGPEGIRAYFGKAWEQPPEFLSSPGYAGIACYYGRPGRITGKGKMVRIRHRGFQTGTQCNRSEYDECCLRDGIY